MRYLNGFPVVPLVWFMKKSTVSFCQFVRLDLVLMVFIFWPVRVAYVFIVFESSIVVCLIVLGVWYSNSLAILEYARSLICVLVIVSKMFCL